MVFDSVYESIPYVQEIQIIESGDYVVLDSINEDKLKDKTIKLFENSRTLPALGVVFEDMYREIIKEGYFVRLIFADVFEINDLPFDELIFEVKEDYYGFNVMRSLDGKVDGRCIYVDLLDKNMSEYYASLKEIKKTP